MAKEQTKIMRKRTVVLSDDAVQNVKKFACARLNKAATAVKVFGQCYGSKYDWTPEQIDKAQQVLTAQVNQAIDNIKTGKKIAAAGISL